MPLCSSSLSARRAFFNKSAERTYAINRAAARSHAFRNRGSYAELKMPVAIIAGAEDPLVDPNREDVRTAAS